LDLRVAQGACSKRPLFLLQLDDAIFDGATDGETRDLDISGLADTMRPVDGLVFNSRIPV